MSSGQPRSCFRACYTRSADQDREVLMAILRFIECGYTLKLYFQVCFGGRLVQPFLEAAPYDLETLITVLFKQGQCQENNYVRRFTWKRMHHTDTYMLGPGLNNQLFLIAGYLLPLTEFLTDGEMMAVSERSGTWAACARSDFRTWIINHLFRKGCVGMGSNSYGSVSRPCLKGTSEIVVWSSCRFLNQTF